jgi:RNA polymerase sigma factor (TIGR02999 family)
MNDVTRILSGIEQGDPRAAEQLLPLVYAELRRLAAQKLTREAPGQTLQATALVHEAYLRLVGSEDPGWNGRGHFFAAAAEAMRRILVEKARRERRLRHGGGAHRVDLSEVDVIAGVQSEDLMALDEALERLARTDPDAAQLVKLRYFAGLTMAQAAESLGIPLRTAERNWTYARTWLHRQVTRGEQTDNP